MVEVGPMALFVEVDTVLFMVPADEPLGRGDDLVSNDSRLLGS